MHAAADKFKQLWLKKHAIEKDKLKAEIYSFPKTKVPDDPNIIKIKSWLDTNINYYMYGQNISDSNWY